MFNYNQIVCKGKNYMFKNHVDWNKLRKKNEISLNLLASKSLLPKILKTKNKSRGICMIKF